MANLDQWLEIATSLWLCSMTLPRLRAKTVYTSMFMRQRISQRQEEAVLFYFGCMEVVFNLAMLACRDTTVLTLQRKYIHHRA
jgi:hypothetical protein